MDVHTGTEGVLTVPDDLGNPRGIYLFRDEQGSEFIHPPAHYWKVSKRGLNYEH